MEPNANLLSELTDKSAASQFKKKFYNLNKSLAKIIEDYSLVKFHPIDIQDEESINDTLLIIDNVLQYGEDREVKEPKELEPNDDQEDNNQYNDDE